MANEMFAEAEKDYREIIANDPSQAKQLSILLTEARFRRTTIREEYEEDMRALLRHHLTLTDAGQDQTAH